MLPWLRWWPLILGLSFTALANDEFRATVQGPPAGFESLLEPQITAVDVYFGGRFLVTSLAEFTDDTLRFLQPERIVESVGQWRDRALAADLLAQDLPTHDHLLCHGLQSPDCGTLVPETLGVIFDVTRFTAELFVAPQLLARPDTQAQRYLPEGESSQITAVQNINLLVSGDSEDNRNDIRYNLFGRTRAGRNDRFGFAEFASTDEQGLLVDELGYHHGWPDHSLDVGLFEQDPNTLRATGRDLMMGLRLARSLERLSNRERLIATPLEVFLPRRSRVNVFAEGRLIETGFYEAGYQLIETDGFPAGSYLVDIVAIDSAGVETREQRFFVKSALLAPPGEPLWQIALGSTGARATEQTLPAVEQDWQLRGDYRWRQTDWLGLGVAGAANRQEGLGELSASAITPWLSIGGELFASSRGASGWSLRGSARWRSSHLSLSTQRQSASSGEEDHRLVTQSLASHSAFFSQRWGNSLLGLSVTRSRQTDGTVSERRTLRLSQLVRLTHSNRLQLSASLSRIDDETQIGLSLQWLAGGARWRYGAAHERIHDDRGEQTSRHATSAYSRWDTSLEDGSRWNVNLGARTDDSGDELTLDTEHRATGGESRLGLAHRNLQGRNATQYTLGHQSSLTLGPDHSLRWGGLDRGLAAVLVNLETVEAGRVDVLVDGRRAVTTDTGRQVPLTLKPYREYVIDLRDRGTQLLQLQGGEQRVVLYPGDVKTVRWEVEAIHIVLARVYTTQRHCLPGQRYCLDLVKPLDSAPVLGTSGWAETTATGFLQAEIAAGTKRLEARDDAGPCWIDLEPLPERDGILRSEMLLCRPIRPASTPAQS